MKTQAIVLLLLAGFAAGVAVLSAACATTRPDEKQMVSEAPPPRWAPAEYAAMAESGQQVFTANCLRCHTVDGMATAPGPDLSDYGSEDFSHVRTADYIRDPQRYYPGTKMPSFGEGIAQKGEALTPAQIDDVTAYVSSLRQRADYLPKGPGPMPPL